MDRREERRREENLSRGLTQANAIGLLRLSGTAQGERWTVDDGRRATDDARPTCARWIASENGCPSMRPAAPRPRPRPHGVGAVRGWVVEEAGVHSAARAPFSRSRYHSSAVVLVSRVSFRDASASGTRSKKQVLSDRQQNEKMHFPRELVMKQVMKITCP